MEKCLLIQILMEGRLEPGTNLNGYTIIEYISKTKSYTVYSGTSSLGVDVDVWIKEYNIRTRKLKNSFAQETANITKLNLLSERRTSNVITLLAYFEHNGCGYVIFPAEGVPLDTVYANFTREEKIRIFYGIVCGLDECYKAVVAHLDLQPKNILILNNQHVLLTNFHDSLRWTSLKSTSMKQVGKKPYRAPEITDPCGYSPFLADYWSLGILLHLLLSDSFPEIVDNDVIIDSKFEGAEKELVGALLQVNPRTRPPFLDFVLQHELFSQNDIFVQLRLGTKKKRKNALTAHMSRVVSFTGFNKHKKKTKSSNSPHRSPRM